MGVLQKKYSLFLLPYLLHLLLTLQSKKALRTPNKDTSFLANLAFLIVSTK